MAIVRHFKFSKFGIVFVYDGRTDGRPNCCTAAEQCVLCIADPTTTLLIASDGLRDQNIVHVIDSTLVENKANSSNYYPTWV